MIEESTAHPIGSRRRARLWSVAMIAISLVLAVSGAEWSRAGSADYPVPSTAELAPILAGLRNPRILQPSDLTNDWRQSLSEFSLSLVVSGDFNRDGIPDIAVVGRYENRPNAEDRVFVAILSRTKSGWRKDFVLPIDTRYAAVEVSRNFTIATEAVVIWFTYAPSDDYALIYWDGARYRTESGFDIMAEQVRKLLPVPRD